MARTFYRIRSAPERPQAALQEIADEHLRVAAWLVQEAKQDPENAADLELQAKFFSASAREISLHGLASIDVADAEPVVPSRAGRRRGSRLEDKSQPACVAR